MAARSLALLCTLCALAVVPASASAAPKKVVFKFSATSLSVAESAGTLDVTVLRSGNTRVAATVTYGDNGTGTATGGVDYALTGGTLSFAAGETKKTFPVTILDNATADAPNKTIVVKLSNATPAGSQIRTTTAKITIIDDEGPGTLDFSASSSTVLEDAGVATVTVNRLGAPNLRLSVDYATQLALVDPASAVTDYTPISPARTLIFEPGEVSKTFQVAIADDAEAEGLENIALVLSNPRNLTGGAAPQIGPNGPAQLTIADDDVSEFAFSAPAYSVREDDPAGHATITVTRTGATNVPASVGYATSNGTASAGADYTAASGTLAFAAGQTSRTFDVTVADDGASEANETVNLTLTSGAATVATALLSIVDDDNTKASVQLAAAAIDVGEADGTATITVTLSHAVDADVTVQYATADGTATAGADYTATSGTLTFAGNTTNGGPGTGETSKTIQIPIASDPDPEDPETLTLTLSSALPGASAVLGAPATGTVTIDDDDAAGQLEFRSLHVDAAEHDGQATVAVRRSGGTTGAVSVDYRTADGTAAAGADYGATSGTLTWGDGDGAEKTFTVPVAWDGRAEGTETVTLTLTDPGGGADLGPNAAAVVRIGDDGAGGAFALSAGAYRVSESGGAVTITVTRAGGGLGGPVSVDYATADGTAIAGSDYGAASGTLTFAPGQATRSFSVPVTADAADESDETFRVTLANAGGGATVGSAAGDVTIVDDDQAPAGAGTPAGPTPPAAPAGRDRTAPRLRLTAKRTQRALRARRLALWARCSERCRLAAVAKVRVGRRTVVLARAKATGRAARPVALKLRLSKKARGRLRRAMRHRRARVVLAVGAVDAAGNRAAASRRVTVRR